MSARLERFAPWVMFSGLLALLTGLGWDAIIHARQPELAEHESVFTLSNPAHLLFAGGIAVVVLGMLLFLLGRAGDSRASFARRLLAIGLAVGLFVCSGASFTVALATSKAHTHSTDTAAVTDAEKIAATQLVSSTKAGTTRFADFKVAQAEGYKQITPFRFGNTGPAHFHNQAYNTDGRILDTTRPEDLIYYKQPSGELVLIGAMYLAPLGQGPRVGGALTHWHSHDNLCFNNAGMVVATKNVLGQCPKGTTFGGNTQEMLHVWLYDNPEGGQFSESMSPNALASLVKQATANK